MSWRVNSVMTTEVVHVRPDTPFKECVDMIRVHRVGALPVLDLSGRLLGILSESDLLRKEEHSTGPAGRRAIARTAADAMTSDLITAPPEATLAEAARLMHASSIRHLPITDASGRLLGIVSRADLLKVFLRSDESIRRETVEVLLPRAFGIPIGGLEIEVRDGVVRIGGEVETSSTAQLIVAFIERVEGVVGVEDKIVHRLNDTPQHGADFGGVRSDSPSGVPKEVLPVRGEVPSAAGRKVGDLGSLGPLDDHLRHEGGRGRGSSGDRQRQAHHGLTQLKR
jgi:CBS domain-containing protein